MLVNGNKYANQIRMINQRLCYSFLMLSFISFNDYRMFQKGLIAREIPFSNFKGNRHPFVMLSQSRTQKLVS